MILLESLPKIASIKNKEIFPRSNISNLITLAIINGLLGENYNADFWDDKDNDELHKYSFIYQMRIKITDFGVYNTGLKNSPATVKGRVVLYEIPSSKASGIGKVEKRDEFNFTYSGIFHSTEKKEAKELSLQTFCSKAAEDTELNKNLKRILPKNISFE